jgi:hypothetical protein
VERRPLTANQWHMSYAIKPYAKVDGMMGNGMAAKGVKVPATFRLPGAPKFPLPIWPAGAELALRSWFREVMSLAREHGFQSAFSLRQNFKCFELIQDHVAETESKRRSK